MLSNLVTIPTIIKPERVARLAHRYAFNMAVKSVWILDNGHEDLQTIYKYTRGEVKISIVPTYGMKLYEQWNFAIKRATELNYDTVTISNDDIDIAEDLIYKMQQAISSDEDCWIVYPANKSQYDETGFTVQTHGTKADGGLDGCCFMLKTQAVKEGLPPIDENFIWWGGDDDLVINIDRMNKKQLRVVNTWVDHQNEGTVSNGDQFLHLHEAKKNDIAYLRSKWRINR